MSSLHPLSLQPPAAVSEHSLTRSWAAICSSSASCIHTPFPPVSCQQSSCFPNLALRVRHLEPAEKVVEGWYVKLDRMPSPRNLVNQTSVHMSLLQSAASRSAPALEVTRGSGALTMRFQSLSHDRSAQESSLGQAQNHDSRNQPVRGTWPSLEAIPLEHV